MSLKNSFNSISLHSIILGWLGYTENKVKDLCKKYLDDGFDAFKVKVGQNLDNDRSRCQMVREVIGYDKTMLSKICIFSLKF